MVIQRWQSVLLLIAAVLMGLFTFSSLGQFQLPDYTLDFTTMGISSEGIADDGAKNVSVPTLYLFVVSALSSLLLLIDIFLFKNLRLQKRVCAVAILTTLATIVQGAVLGYTAVESAVCSWSSIVIAPFIAVIAAWLAYRFISSDQAKLRSVDRLR